MMCLAMACCAMCWYTLVAVILVLEYHSKERRWTLTNPKWKRNCS